MAAILDSKMATTVFGYIYGYIWDRMEIMILNLGFKGLAVMGKDNECLKWVHDYGVGVGVFLYHLACIDQYHFLISDTRVRYEPMLIPSM